MWVTEYIKKRWRQLWGGRIWHCKTHDGGPTSVNHLSLHSSPPLFFSFSLSVPFWFYLVIQKRERERLSTRRAGYVTSSSTPGKSNFEFNKRRKEKLLDRITDDTQIDKRTQRGMGGVETKFVEKLPISLSRRGAVFVGAPILNTNQSTFPVQMEEWERKKIAIQLINTVSVYEKGGKNRSWRKKKERKENDVIRIEKMEQRHAMVVAKRICRMIWNSRWQGPSYSFERSSGLVPCRWQWKNESVTSVARGGINRCCVLNNLSFSFFRSHYRQVRYIWNEC